MSNSMKVEDRAKRYIVLVGHYGHTPSVAQKHTQLPTILQSAINKVIFQGKDHELRVELSKLQAYLDYCLESYRSYYRNRTQLQEG